MVDLEQLSRIGFGGHLISMRSAQHRDALVRALQLGCNVVDTSANYMDGESEQLIGQVLKEHPEFDAFVITKSGVVVESTDSGEDPIASTAGDCLHPDFLRERINVSLEQLQLRRIDAYLLHNPEVKLAQAEDGDKQTRFYAELEQAFVFLEDAVKGGIIRYYGVSSNTFHLPTANHTTINLHRVLTMARAISPESHFKFVEFPFNVVESGAIQAHHDGVSLVELARANGLIAISNRPLNANTPTGALRLALDPEDLVSVAEPEDRAVVDAAIERIRHQLRAIGEDDDPLAFGVVQLLKKKWMDIGNPEAVQQVFHEYLDPLLMQLYGDLIPEEDRQAYEDLYAVVLRRARGNRARRTENFRDSMAQLRDVPEESQPLSRTVCENYLRAGIRCVLVGMRKTRYVEQLKPLFRAPLGTVSYP